MMLFSINPAFDLYPADVHVLNDSPDAAAFQGMDPTRASSTSLCAQKGIGITVMKTLGAGKLISPSTPFGKPMTVPQCIHYALTRPAVAGVMLGCKNRAEVLEGVRYLDTSEEERDYTPVLGFPAQRFPRQLRLLQPLPALSGEIDIAAVNKYLDIARLDEGACRPPFVPHYLGLSHTGSECIACGSCEARCPFGVPIIEKYGRRRTDFRAVSPPAG